MSLALKYGMKKKMAKGGMADKACDAHGAMGCQMCDGGMMAEGGMVGEEMESGYEKMPAPSAEDDAGDDGSEGIVDRIMKRFAKGGMVANDSMPIADDESAEFDELAKDDTKSSDYVDDGPGDEEEDKDREDIVGRIMKSRDKKGKMPRPA